MKKLSMLLIIVLMSSIFSDGELLAKKEYYGIEVKAVSVKREPALLEGAGVRGAFWVDDLISIAWTVRPKKFGFFLGNRVMSPMKILWDECRIHDPEGNRRRVLHKGVRYIAKDMSPYQTPTLIKPGKKIRNHIAPILVEPKENGRIKAHYEPMYMNYKMVTKKIYKGRKTGNTFDGEAYAEKQRFTVELVLDVDGQKYRYFFYFQGKLAT
jgi:hypothetical protein